MADATSLFTQMLNNVMQFGDGMINPAKPSLDNEGKNSGAKPAPETMANQTAVKGKSALPDIGNSPLSHLLSDPNGVEDYFNKSSLGQLTNIFDKYGSKIFGTSASSEAAAGLTDAMTSANFGSETVSKGRSGIIAAILSIL